MTHNLDDVRSWVIDVDGCLVSAARAGGKDGSAIPGAADLIDFLRKREDQFVVCTNASERPPREYAAHLRELGLSIEDDVFMTAGSAAADHIVHHYPNGTVLVVGGEGLQDPLRERGAQLAEPGGPLADVVMVGASRNYSADLIDAACLAVDAGAPLLATVDVPWFQGGRGKSVSVSSAISMAIGWVTHVTPTVVGKPSPFLAEALRRRLGNGPAAVIGDSVVEVELARHMDATAALVLTGATRADEVPTLTYPHQPDLVFGDVGELFTSLTTGGIQ